MSVFVEAIQALAPNCAFAVEGEETHANIVWHEDNSVSCPTASEISAKMTEIEADKGNAAMRHVRAKRAMLMSETDWWATSDRTMTAEQTAYRQALRDLPSTYPNVDYNSDGELINFTWPTKPE